MRIVKNTVIQILALIGIAFVAGLSVNAARSKDHIKIDYTYVRTGTHNSQAGPSTQQTTGPSGSQPTEEPHENERPDGPAANSNVNATADPPSEPEFLNGYRVVHVAEVRQLLADPRFLTHEILLIDARDDHAYQAGHIAGAVQFDHYRPDQYRPRLEEMLAYAPHQIIVYCNGGDCEDSLEVCVLLETDFYQQRGSLLLFKGGWEAWTKAKLPVKTGAEE